MISEIINKYKSSSYPCRDCIIKVNCTELCDKLLTDDLLSVRLLNNSRECPDCSGDDLFFDYRMTDIYIRCNVCGHIFRFNNSLPVSSVKRLT